MAAAFPVNDESKRCDIVVERDGDLLDERMYDLLLQFDRATGIIPDQREILPEIAKLGLDLRSDRLPIRIHRNQVSNPFCSSSLAFHRRSSSAATNRFLGSTSSYCSNARRTS